MTTSNASVPIIRSLPTNTQAVLSQEVMLSVRPLLLQCARDNNVSDAQLAAIIANDLTNNTRNTQCLALCFMQQLRMFDVAGNIDVPVTKALFSKGERAEFVDEVVEQCKEQRGADACETAARVYACYVHKGLL